MTEKKFAKGLVYKEPREGAPSFVVANLSIKVDEFKNWLIQHQEGEWMNIDVKRGRDTGKIYCELSTWKPNQPDVRKDEVEENQSKLNNLEYPEEEINIDDIPF